MNKIKFSIVIPCFNEAKSLPALLHMYKQAVTRDDIQIVVVNNGSSDESKTILDKATGDYPFLKVVTVSVNQGYGFGILSGLKEADGEYLGWTHGDLQAPAGDIIKAVEIIEREGNPQNIYVKGNRKERPPFDNFFTFGMTIFESVYLRCFLYDINAQPNIFHKNFFASWSNPPYDFSLDLYALYQAKKQKLRIVRFPVIFGKRIHGESHWNVNWMGKWKFIKRTLQFTFKLKKSFALKK